MSTSEIRNKESGFNITRKISKKMADFLNIDPKGKYSIVTISKGIVNYAKENDLYTLDDKRIIVLDEKLKILLDYQQDYLTYFELQRYLRHHFVKDS
jgi:chromatin remodeling complex protein RSC6